MSKLIMSILLTCFSLIASAASSYNANQKINTNDRIGIEESCRSIIPSPKTNKSKEDLQNEQYFIKRCVLLSLKSGWSNSTLKDYGQVCKNLSKKLYNSDEASTFSCLLVAEKNPNDIEITDYANGREDPLSNLNLYDIASDLDKEIVLPTYYLTLFSDKNQRAINHGENIIANAVTFKVTKDLILSKEDFERNLNNELHQSQENWPNWSVSGIFPVTQTIHQNHDALLEYKEAASGGELKTNINLKKGTTLVLQTQNTSSKDKNFALYFFTPIYTYHFATLTDVSTDQSYVVFLTQDSTEFDSNAKIKLGDIEKHTNGLLKLDKILF